MKTLINTMQKYADMTRTLGKESSKNGLSEKQVNDLRKDLSNISSRNNKFFLFIISLVALIFLLSLIFVIYNINEPEKIKVTFGATGISIMGLIIFMNKLWKEKVSADILLALIVTLQTDMINSILVALLKKM